MDFMVIETFRNGKQPVYDRFQAQGRMLPDGLRYVDSWVESDGNRCFQLMQTEDLGLFEQWTAQWKDLVDFEIVQVTPSPTKNNG